MNKPNIDIFLYFFSLTVLYPIQGWIEISIGVHELLEWYERVPIIFLYRYIFSSLHVSGHDDGSPNNLE